NDKIKFEIKNIGETQAKLLSRCVGVQTTAPVFQRPERNPQTFKEDVTLPSGQGIGREFDYSKPSDTTSTNIWCFGSIVYKDGAGMVRTTGFCRSYDKDTERFTPLQDSDYEYAY
ncbi:MAG: hypothetical protein KGQ70_04690, partial [Alphaproteobacteria bacterium]|nr:hypothetical protein [Alphaproteobacteria bacterium]